MVISPLLPDGVKCKVLYDGPRDANWLEARRTNGVGASESPGVLGVSRFSTPYSVYANKIGGEQSEPGEAAHWGQILEPIILNEFKRETKRTCIEESRTLQSDDQEYMLASPDGWQRDERKRLGTVQIKASIVDWEDDGVPHDVWCQMQHEFYVTGVGWGTAVALLNGNRMRWLDIERDDEFIGDVLVPTVGVFWHHITLLDPLPENFIDGRPETKKALERMFPETATGDSIQLPGEYLAMHKEFAALKDDRKEINSKIALIENKLRAIIGVATSGVLPDGSSYTLKTVDKKAHEVAAAQYRQLRFKKAKGA